MRITIEGTEQFGDAAKQLKNMSERTQELLNEVVGTSAEFVTRAWKADFAAASTPKFRTKTINRISNEQLVSDASAIEWEIGPLTTGLANIAIFGGSRGGGHRMDPSIIMTDSVAPFTALVEKAVEVANSW